MSNKALNLKNMKETLVNYCDGDAEEFDKIWSSFVMMKHLGFISRDLWFRFSLECGAWVIDGDYLVDNESGERIFDFDNARDGSMYEPYKVRG